MGRNVDTVKAIYDEFRRGDVARILERCRDDVTWDDHMADHGVPWLKNRRGKQDVTEFFRIVSDFEFLKFEPQDYLEGANKVAVTLRVEANVRSTGGKFAEDMMHLFIFDDEGRVAAFRHYLDTHQHVIAAGVEARKQEIRKRAA